MAINGRDIVALERAVSNELAKYEQGSQAIYDKIEPVKVNAMNPQFPVFKGMIGYNPNGNTGVGGDKSQVLLTNPEFKPAAVFQQEKNFEIPIAAKRAMAAIDDPEGQELVKLITNGVLASKQVTLDFNIHNAVIAQTYTNGTNIFNAGNINADVAGGGFRGAINDAVAYLKSSLNGLNSNMKIIVVIPESAWYKLTASQKLVNYFNGYANTEANFNLNTINAIFSENAGIKVEFHVAGLRFLDSKFAEGKADLIWNDTDKMYAFVTTSSVFADRASIKRLEGVELLKAEQRGFSTHIDFYCEYGYYIDVPEAFAQVKFETA